MKTGIKLKDNMNTTTILFYDCNSLELQQETLDLQITNTGRVVIPDEFKEGRSIVAVCDGTVKILNKLGDRLDLNLFRPKL